MLHNSTEQSFQQDVLNSDVTVLVDFWAPWCGPCKMMSPVLEKLAEKLDGKVKIVKVDIDENPNLGAKYGVRGIPTLMVFNGGEVTNTLVGAAPANKIEALLA